MRRIKISYQKLTPLTLEQFGHYESGWVDKDGIEIVVDDYDIEQYGSELEAVVALVIEEIGYHVEPSCSDWKPHIWYTDVDPDRDYEDGSETYQSYHLVGFSEEEERAIFEELT